MYYMTMYRPGEEPRWSFCKATTLMAAKAEANRTFGKSWKDAVLEIGVEDRGEPSAIARRYNYSPMTKWTDFVNAYRYKSMKK